MATSDNDFSSSLLSPRGVESFQVNVGRQIKTDIDRTVFLDPLGRWRTIQEFG